MKFLTYLIKDGHGEIFQLRNNLYLNCIMKMFAMSFILYCNKEHFVFSQKYYKVKRDQECDIAHNPIT